MLDARGLELSVGDSVMIGAQECTIIAIYEGSPLAAGQRLPGRAPHIVAQPAPLTVTFSPDQFDRRQRIPGIYKLPANGAGETARLQ